MPATKTIALVAHDNRKSDLSEWVKWNAEALVPHRLVCTGTTGLVVENTLRERFRDSPDEESRIQIVKLKSGPLGGDQQLGALVTENKIDALIFFWDPMEPHPHDVDVKALLRIAVVYNVPIACNRSTADFIISSPLMEQNYQPIRRSYETYIRRPSPLPAGEAGTRL
jgi:methylglyoxal synthase